MSNQPHNVVSLDSFRKVAPIKQESDIAVAEHAAGISHSDFDERRAVRDLRGRKNHDSYNGGRMSALTLGEHDVFKDVPFQYSEVIEGCKFPVGELNAVEYFLQGDGEHPSIRIQKKVDENSTVYQLHAKGELDTHHHNFTLLLLRLRAILDEKIEVIRGARTDRGAHISFWTPSEV